MKELAGMSLKELQAMMSAWGQPVFRAGQVFSWIFEKRVLDFGRMSNLPETLRGRLGKECVVSSIVVQSVQRSLDGTVKLLVRLADGNFVESVAIPTEKRYSPAVDGRPSKIGGGRLTGCISSQAGCRFNCAFCASGKAGFKRNLTPGEMCGEALWLKDASQGNELSHIVFMGTGEPLDNYDNVLAAVRQLNSPEAFGIGARRITISTCGIVPGIRRLAGEGMQIELSVSLHASDDTTRSALMPVNRIYPLKELMAACREYAATTRRQITFEYILIEGLNSDLHNADRLSTIVKGMDCKINLIPLNPVSGEKRRPPDRRTTQVFRDVLLKSGVQATVRQPRGQDIDAACGQLRARYEKK